MFLVVPSYSTSLEVAQISGLLKVVLLFPLTLQLLVSVP